MTGAAERGAARRSPHPVAPSRSGPRGAWRNLPPRNGWLPPVAALPFLVLALGLTLVAAGPGVLPGDVAVARAVQEGAFPGAEELAGFVWHLGNTAPIIAAAVTLVLLLWLRRRHWEALLLVGAIAARGLNPALKRAVESPRPTDDLVRVNEVAAQYGFPSGHTIGVTLLYGCIAVLARLLLPRGWARWTVQVACVALIVATGWGRIYRGAHWPSDVLGGYLWGVAILIVLVEWLPGPARRAAVPAPGADADKRPEGG